MRSRAVAVVCLVLTLGTLLVKVGPAANASCIGPDVNVTPSSGRQGSTITITGHNYWDRCNDVLVCHVFTPTPSPSPGATSTPTPSPTQSCETPDPMLPLKDVRLEFAQHGRVWRLGTVDANNDGAISFVSHVPSDADAGAAEIRACPYEPRCTYPKVAFRIGSIAGTGSDGSPWQAVAVGSGMLLVGLAFLTIARRRGSRTA